MSRLPPPRPPTHPPNHVRGDDAVDRSRRLCRPPPPPSPSERLYKASRRPSTTAPSTTTTTPTHPVHQPHTYTTTPMPQAVPLRVPGRNRGRNSLPGSDEISHLSLGEVRDRLARNERVLNTSLFSTSPTASSSFGSGFSPTAPRQVPTADAPDPVRDRLLAVREQLRAREAELLADGMSGMSLSPSSPSRLASSPPTRSGKARALDAIRQGELNLAPNSMVL